MNDDTLNVHFMHYSRYKTGASFRQPFGQITPAAAWRDEGTGRRGGFYAAIPLVARRAVPTRVRLVASRPAM
jgi:hypothetical protein